MKKFLYTAMSLVMSIALFTACSDDEGGNSQPVSKTPAADVAGQYVGTFTTSYLDPNTQLEVIQHFENVVVTISEVEGNDYLINIEQPAIDTQVAVNGVANISCTTSSAYPFVNKTDNTSGSTVAGKFPAIAGAIKDGVIAYSYALEETRKIGARPKKVTTTYSFDGELKLLVE